MATDKFNDGGVTSTSIDRQFRPEKVLDAIVQMPKRKRIFSSRASMYNMPKNHGDTLTQEIRYSMLDDKNLAAGNIDANTAVIAKGVFYRTNANGDVIAKYDANDYLIENAYDFTAASAAAQAAAEADKQAGELVKASSNGIINGQAEYSAFSGQVVPLPEEGGMVNGLTSTRKLVSAKINFFGVHHKYTLRSVNLDSRAGEIARKIVDLGDAVSQIKEHQVMHDLLAAGNNNLTISTNDASVVVKSEIDGNDVLTYESLEAYGLELQRNDVPMDTEIIKGVDLQDTVTVSDAYIAYINREVVPTLTRLVGPGGVIPWKPKEQYAAGTTLLDGEVGMITGLPFRFVVVPDMPREHGAGEVVGADNDSNDGDSADADQQAKMFKTINTSTGDYNYDVFTLLVVGDDSFTIAGFGGNQTKAKRVPAKSDVHNDIFGEVEGIFAKWSYGMLVYRPERIATLAFSLSKSGN